MATITVAASVYLFLLIFRYSKVLGRRLGTTKVLSFQCKYKTTNNRKQLYKVCWLVVTAVDVTKCKKV